MRLHRTPARRRDGFTLIELLVVMAIIAVLAGLTTAAVFAAFNKMWEVQCRNEITGLGTSIKQFESDFNVSLPPPSRLWLDETGSYSNVPAGVPNGTTVAQLQQLHADSEAYLGKVWPRHAYPIDWNSDGTAGNSNVVLEGEQVPVFFLGGARKINGEFIGFAATNPGNPMDQSNPAKRKGPYFQFAMNRVLPLNGQSNYPVYFDTYFQNGNANNKPYAYFSSGKSTNGYNAYVSVIGYDCPSLTTPAAAPIQPYYQPPAANNPSVVYYNSDTFQIISAGKDQAFGPGGSWTGTNPTAVGPAGLDDLTNFARSKLGTPQ